VTTYRLPGNQQYSWIQTQRSWFVQPDATMQPGPQDNQLMSKHRVLSLKP
jgi:hypothetical protein